MATGLLVMATGLHIFGGRVVETVGGAILGPGWENVWNQTNSLSGNTPQHWHVVFQLILIVPEAMLDPPTCPRMFVFRLWAVEPSQDMTVSQRRFVHCIHRHKVVCTPNHVMLPSSLLAQSVLQAPLVTLKR